MPVDPPETPPWSGCRAPRFACCVARRAAAAREWRLRSAAFRAARAVCGDTDSLLARSDPRRGPCGELPLMTGSETPLMPQHVRGAERGGRGGSER